MEVLNQARAIVMEHAFTIGIGLVIAVLIAGIAWFWMGRSPAPSKVLENQARVAMAEMDIPESAGAAEPSAPPLSDEERERHMAAMEAQKADNQ